jgi:hypothetical protein
MKRLDGDSKTAHVCSTSLACCPRVHLEGRSVASLARRLDWERMAELVQTFEGSDHFAASAILILIASFGGWTKSCLVPRYRSVV